MNQLSHDVRSRLPQRPPTRAAEGLPRWRWRMTELLRLVELGVLDAGDRLELFGGEIVPMSPAGRMHEVLTDELVQYWMRRAPVEIAIGVERQFNLDEWTYTQPDILLRPAGIKSYDVRGPDVLLVVEVADTSLSKDLGPKAALYASFGVREYWVIAANDRATRVHREPKDGHYTVIAEFEDDVVLQPLFAPAMAVLLGEIDTA